MISDKFRFIYFGQMLVKTFMNYFPNDVPTMHSLMTDLKQREAKSPSLIGQGKREVSISDIRVERSHVAILFEVADPDIQDHYVHDTNKNTTRLHARNADEIPVVSIHVVIDCSTQHDIKKVYPAAIENNPYLPRTYVMNALNSILSIHFNREKKWKEKKGKVENRVYSPRIAFGAAASQTISGMLNNGGALSGVSWVDITPHNGPQGTGTYTVSETKSVNMKVSGRPKGQDAFGLVESLVRKIPKGAKTTSIIVVDENDKEKVIGFDRSKPDIFGTVFIPQKKIQLPPGNYLPSHVSSLHKDYVSNIRKKLV